MNKSVIRLPDAPGVYFFKDTGGGILYIGKSISIKKRVQSYFQRSSSDWKVAALVQDHATIDFIGTANETEALLLEAQLIKEHTPKYNVLLKSGHPFVYILFTRTSGDILPVMKVVRNKKEKGYYFGPFLHKSHARGAHQYLLSTFKLYLCNKKIENGCLDYHIGICAGSCMQGFDRDGYLLRLKLARMALRSRRVSFLRELKKEIKVCNERLLFERSAQLAQYAENLDTIFTTLATRYSPDKYADACKMVLEAGDGNGDDAGSNSGGNRDTDGDVGSRLQQLLGLEKPVVTIDCFDISHFQSSFLVGSAVRFTNGQPEKSQFRHFKIKSLQQQNDYAALQEIVSRRYRDTGDIPDLVLIDGGKGQLSAVKQILPAGVVCVSLAKREETLYGEQFPDGVRLDLQTGYGRLLIAIRDYAHHFAIEYHRKLRRERL